MSNEQARRKYYLYKSRVISSLHPEHPVALIEGTSIDFTIGLFNDGELRELRDVIDDYLQTGAHREY